MTKGNSTSVLTIRLPDAVVARIKTIARRKRQTVNEMLKKVIMGFVVGDYYSEEQVAELCETEPLAWGIEPASKTSLTKVGRNDPCPCGAKWPDGRPKKIQVLSRAIIEAPIPLYHGGLQHH